MKIQALDKQGQWNDIEYLPSSWCGNSYHHVKLAPGSYWSFVMPVYEGEIKTKLRAELDHIGDDRECGKTIYSNEIEGSINPAQFWNKTTYYPNGLMDPYND
jgi:hypothetical protein